MKKVFKEHITAVIDYQKYGTTSLAVFKRKNIFTDTSFASSDHRIFGAEFLKDINGKQLVDILVFLLHPETGQFKCCNVAIDIGFGAYIGEVLEEKGLPIIRIFAGKEAT